MARVAVMGEPKNAPAYRVDAVRGREAFAALRAEWEAVVASGPADLPFASHGWLAAWLAAFAPDAEPVVLAARGPDGAAVGFAAFLEESPRRWVAPANDHSCRFEWALGRDARGATAALWSYLRDHAAWDVLLLRDLPRDGPTSTYLEPLARADGHLTGRWASQRSPYLALGAAAGPGGAEARTSAKFRANLRRRLKRLEELGAVALRREDGSGDLEAALEDFLALEAAGWKGRGGTAVAADPRCVDFYRRMARDAAARGALAVRALTLDGRPIAVHLGVVHRGVYYLPKTAYDEALGHVSPGQLLHREVVAECEARGLAALDFLGPDMPWKDDWAPALRPHDWLYVYRPGLAGRARHALRHRLRPVAKEVVSWWR